jgi:hypothetical protein
MGWVSRVARCAASLGSAPVSEPGLFARSLRRRTRCTGVYGHQEPDAQAFMPYRRHFNPGSVTVKVSPDQAAGFKRAKLGIGTILVSRGSPNPSQTRRKASASWSISRSLWNGVGVMRSRSVPFGTVG